MHIASLLNTILDLENTNISVDLSINHLLSKSNIKMYNKSKCERENFKINYQTHSSVARRKLIKSV